MTFWDLMGDVYWIYKRTRAPAFVSSLTGNGDAKKVMPELVKAGIHERKEVLLYLLVRSLRPKRVVETGVWYGWSSRAILSALHANGEGRLFSIDLPTLGAGRIYEDGTVDPTRLDAVGDTGRAVPAYLRDKWDLRIVASPAESTAALAASTKEGIDMFFHDSDHSYENMLKEFQIAWAGLRPAGVLYADDVEWNLALRDFGRSVERTPHIFRLYPNARAAVGALVK